MRTVHTVLLGQVIGVTWFLMAASGAKATFVTPCIEDSTCGKGYICFTGLCVPACRTDSDCKSDQSCANLVCIGSDCVPGHVASCYEGPANTIRVGQCRGGVRTCQGDKNFSACFGQALPQQEICDLVDNDCDGTIDEGLNCECSPGQSRKCYPGPQGTAGVGDCRAGVQYCQTSHEWSKCLESRIPSPEIFDAKDNDCNGRADDDPSFQCTPGAIRSCYSHAPATAGVGECRQGSQVCKVDYTWLAQCFGEQGPVDEIFDEIDNDCDGTVDNVFAPMDTPMLDAPIVIDPAGGIGEIIDGQD